MALNGWGNSFGFRDSKLSSNVDIGDNWLLDSNDPKIHTSYSLVPGKYSFNANPTEEDNHRLTESKNPSFGPILGKETDNKKIGVEINEGKMKENTPTMLAGRHAPSVGNRESPTHLNPRWLHKDNHESPDRSEYSSRIKVDCGSESESEYCNGSISHPAQLPHR